MENKSFISYLIILFIGIAIGATITYKHLTTTYFEVHTANIGGFIFKNGKAYTLEELKDF